MYSCGYNFRLSLRGVGPTGRRLDLGKNISFSDSLLSLSKRLGFLCNEDSSLIEPKIVEIEKVLNGLIRALQDD